MIKAEIITHEGNPGPNWLDHCRTAITTWTATVAIVAAAVVLVLVMITHRSHASQAQQLPVSTMPAAPTSPLAVQPLGSADAVQPTATNVQASAGTGASSGDSSNNSASEIGAEATPSLNTAANSSQTTNSRATTDPTGLTGQQLTQTVQSIVPAVPNTVTKALTKLGLPL